MAVQTEYAPGEIVKRGKEIYKASIKAQVEPEHIGKYLAINVDTDEWEMGEDHQETFFSALDKFDHPHLFVMRIGYAAAESFHGALRPLHEIAAEDERKTSDISKSEDNMETQIRLSDKEMLARGKKIYETKIRPVAEPDHIGEYLSINVENGEWEMGKDHLETALRARARFPNAEILGMRVGYLVTESLGGGIRTIAETS